MRVFLFTYCDKRTFSTLGFFDPYKTNSLVRPTLDIVRSSEVGKSLSTTIHKTCSPFASYVGFRNILNSCRRPSSVKSA